MTNTDLIQGVDLLKGQIKKFGTKPNLILMKAHACIELLSKSYGWNLDIASNFINILLTNNFLKYDGLYLYLTEEGYAYFNEASYMAPPINLPGILTFDELKSTKDSFFYQLWDLIGNEKGENPYYVDGPLFFYTAKKFIPGLPPSYSQYDKDIKEKNGKPVSRVSWGKQLFLRLPNKNIPAFLTDLSKAINDRIITSTKSDTNQDGAVEDLEFLHNEENNQSNPRMNTETKTPKIFISHSTKDQPYAKALVNMLIALGINEEEDVFCSSMPGLGVGFGDDFIQAIREQYEHHKLIVLFIHSPRYYNSHISLCEMGAAWIMKYDHRSFLTADCEFSMLDAVIPSTETAFRAGQGNTYHLLHDFKNYIESEFKLKPKNAVRWEEIKNDFINATSEFIPTE